VRTGALVTPGALDAAFAVIADAAADPGAGAQTRLAGVLAGILADPRGGLALVHDFDPAARELVLLGAAGLGEGPGPVRTALGHGVAGWVASRRVPALVADRRCDPRGDHLAGLSPQCGGAAGPAVTGVAVPVPSAGAYVGGVIEVYAPAAYPGPEDSDVPALARLAAVLGLVLDHTRPPPGRRQAGPRNAADGLGGVAIRAQEAERQRLAADLHDGISQRLASLAFHLAAADDALPGDPAFAADQVRAARTVTALTLAEVRSVAHDLRPPGIRDLGLAAGLVALGPTVPGVVVEVEADECELPDHVEIALYRVAQEALHNVLKHAAAGRAQLILTRGPDGVLLRVGDDGCGFVSGSAHEGLGVAGMRERVELLGGCCEVLSRPGEGTVVEVSVPGV